MYLFTQIEIVYNDIKTQKGVIKIKSLFTRQKIQNKYNTITACSTFQLLFIIMMDPRFRRVRAAAGFT